MCWIMPPDLTSPYSLIIASAPRRSSSDCVTVPVAMPMWYFASAASPAAARSRTKAIAECFALMSPPVVALPDDGQGKKIYVLL